MITKKQSFVQICNYMDTLSAKYPKYVSSLSIGQTYEKRDMKVIQITKAGLRKPNIFIEAGKKHIRVL